MTLQEKQALVVQMYRQGNSYAEIGMTAKLDNRTIRQILKDYQVYDPERIKMRVKQQKSFKMRQHFKKAEKILKNVPHLFAFTMPAKADMDFAYWVKDRKMPAPHQCKGILTDVKSGMDFWCQEKATSHKGYCEACHSKIYVKKNH